LYKSVPSLAPGDLEISYYNGVETIILPVTGITAQPGNAIFDITVNLPADTTTVSVRNLSEVWLMAGENFPGHLMEGLQLKLRTQFDLWVQATPSIPADRRGMLDRNGPLAMQNLMAYAMGLDPLTATPADMPQVHSLDTVAGSLHIVYRRSKSHYDAWLTPMVSNDLAEWTSANVASQEIIQDGGDWEKVDALVTFEPGDKGFIKLETTYYNW
jgi:hypothetical protein